MNCLKTTTWCENNTFLTFQEQCSLIEHLCEAKAILMTITYVGIFFGIVISICGLIVLFMILIDMCCLAQRKKQVFSSIASSV